MQPNCLLVMVPPNLPLGQLRVPWFLAWVLRPRKVMKANRTRPIRPLMYSFKAGWLCLWQFRYLSLKAASYCGSCGTILQETKTQSKALYFLSLVILLMGSDCIIFKGLRLLRRTNFNFQFFFKVTRKFSGNCAFFY